MRNSRRLGQVVFSATLVLTASSITMVCRASDEKRCSEILVGGAPAPTPAAKSSQVIAYLEHLLHSNVIGTKEFARFSEGLSRGEVLNPILEDEAETSTALHIHRQGLAERLTGGALDKDRLRIWAENTLRVRTQTQDERGAVKNETKVIYQKVEFKPVPPGKFERGNSRKLAQLTHEIEVMSTPMTQRQWVMMFGENPSHFKNGPQAVVEVVQGKSIQMLPNHPVDSLTWWAAVVAANKLSVEHGLKPVYDLSAVKWKKGTRAEDGSLDADSGTYKINAPGGDIYKAEGYRLPTDAEQEYLMRLEHIANSQTDLKERAWFDSNSRWSTHEVAQKDPLNLNGHEIFDIIGNVRQWGHDWDSLFASHGINPIGPSSGESHVLRGGSWSSPAGALDSSFRDFGYTDAVYNDAGVRFVRSRN